MKYGRLYSDKENRFCYTYKREVVKPYRTKCDCCGRTIAENPTLLVWEDDENCLEWTYGSQCIKKLELKDAQLGM